MKITQHLWHVFSRAQSLDVSDVLCRMTWEHVRLVHHHRHHNHSPLVLHWQIEFSVAYRWQTWNNKHQSEQGRGWNGNKIIIATIHGALRHGVWGSASENRRTWIHSTCQYQPCSWTGVSSHGNSFLGIYAVYIYTYYMCALESERDYDGWTGATLTLLGRKHMDAMIQSEKNEQRY